MRFADFNRSPPDAWIRPRERPLCAVHLTFERGCRPEVPGHHRRGSAQESRPCAGTAIKELHEVHRDDNEQGRIECDQGVSELKHAFAAGSLDEFRWTKQVRVQQIRMHRKGEDEHDREDDEGQAGPDSLTIAFVPYGIQIIRGACARNGVRAGPG